jgi:hypothetical protein
VARQLRTKPRIFPFRQESYAEEVREEKGRENDYEEKEELETLNRLSSYCNYAVSTGCSVGRHMLWNAKIKPEGFCAVRPTEFFGKFAPYNLGHKNPTRYPTCTVGHGGSRNRGDRA